MNRRGLVSALVAAAFFGAATPLSKGLLGSIAPVTLAGLLYLGAALGLLPVVLRRGLRTPWSTDRKTQRLLAGAILFGGILGPILMLLGLQQAASGSVSLWLNLEAAFTALLGLLVFRDRLDRNGWLGAGGIVLASLILTWGEGATGLRAGILVALACLCWALDNHLTALIDGVTPEESTLWKGSAAGIVNLTAGFLIAPMAMQALPVVSGALVLGVFAYGISIVLYIRSAQLMGATRSQLLFSSAPFFGLLLAVILLGEPLTWTQVVAGVIIALSVAMLTLERHGHQHEHAALTHDHCHTHDESHHDHSHPGLAAGAQHTHGHIHVAVAHTHGHLPDIHHRHEHENGEDGHDHESVQPLMSKQASDSAGSKLTPPPQGGYTPATRTQTFTRSAALSQLDPNDTPDMAPYARHVFFCTGNYCDPEGRAVALYNRLARTLGDLGAYDNPQRVKRGLSPCLGVCWGGPLMVVYPEGVWYHHVDEARLDRIVEEHLVNDRPVEEYIFHQLGEE